MEFLKLYTDPSVPSHRVARKSALLALLAIVYLFYYRHFELGFGFGKPILATLLLSFILFFMLGVVGAACAASFYGSFLQQVGAQKSASTPTIFFAEWLFAAAAPIFAGVFLLNTSGEGGRGL